MWNRWQDPETGRFISEDPARSGGNWYDYAGNNPINRWDPTGLRQAEGAISADGDSKQDQETISKVDAVAASQSSGKSSVPTPPQPPKPFTFDFNLYFFRWQFNSDSFKLEAGIPLIGYATLGIDQSGDPSTGLHLGATTLLGGAYLDIGRNDGTNNGISFSVDTFAGGADFILGSKFGTSVDAHLGLGIGGIHLGSDWVGGYTPWFGGGYSFASGSTFSSGGVTRMFGVYSGGGYQSNSITNDPSDPSITGYWRMPRNGADRNAQKHDYTYYLQKALATEEEQTQAHTKRNQTLRAESWTWENLLSIDPYNQLQAFGQGAVADFL